MGRVNTPKLDAISYQALEILHRESTNHSLRKRCQTILLKASGRTSKDVGSIVGMSHVSVNSWLWRYQTEGISGLYIKAGRGRKPYFNKQEDESLVLEKIKQHRQSVNQAKADWEVSTDRKTSVSTFKRFLKNLADDIDE